MKKHYLSIALVIVLLLSAGAQAARPIEANTNLASGKSAYGTYSNATAATDGKIKSYATSGDITESTQYLTINLGQNIYLDRVRILWDKDAYSDDFAIRTSPDAKYWNEEAGGMDAANGALDPASDNMSISISLKRAILSSKYVQVMIPAGSKLTNAAGNNNVRIAEVEVYPSVGQKFLLTSSAPYVITDTTCMIIYKTSIGAAGGSVKYGTNPNKLDRTSTNSESGVDNSVVLSGLRPKTTYYYQVNSTDFYGNNVSSAVKSFTTDSENVALKKKVTGTFIYFPNERFVKDGIDSEILARVTDGGTSYFTAMAMSGPVNDSDQYVTIDLGKPYRIKNIISYWRRLAYPESLIVQVSDNNSDWRTIDSGLDVGKGALARSDAGDPMKVVSTSAKGDSGRYVKLLVKKGSPIYHKHAEWNFIQLMEVKVFAE